MNPLSALYGAAVATRNKLFDLGILRARELAAPVVSIGNIRVGGVGKTPFTICLGELLKGRGIAVDVLSRGYKRDTTGVQIVDPNGNASDFGDEPLLISRKLQVPVVVCASRFEAGRVAEQKFHSQMHLLDDGFQHRALARQFDIALVDAGDLEGKLLPSGRLRESVRALRRADALVIPAEEPVENYQRFQKSVWRVQRRIALPEDAPKHPVVFCGLARPQKFFNDLGALGVDIASVVIFPDHHRYARTDIESLRMAAERNGADGFITTEKDLMNLGRMAALLTPLVMALLETQLLDAGKCIQQMLSTIDARRCRRS